ncbi:ROK family protein [Autumnicola musiva]|uniref:ROK family protein n=1 Tax=Autumnicola musiva TaxID=3075589 RepID=A0ABU3D1X5_9FLAO|nr:ROK family protein [Zunongwangia sp. F117]MDT0675394.1 ROK family protein [Zunongwangia sp. F117]
MEKNIVAVDIGATKIHIGIVRGSHIVKEVKFPTNAGTSKEDIVNNLIRGIESLEVKDFQGIGIGVPGLVDEKQGIVYDLVNIASWKEVHLKKYLQDHFHKPVRITNDANVFALGEKIFGQGSRFQNIVGITMGTGFGTGIIANNRLYSGSFSSAGELGSIPYLDATIEDYCSGKFFKNQYQISGKEVFERAEEGDKLCRDILNEFGKQLGNAVKILLFILSPEAIFLGGSVSRSFKYFEDELQKSISTFPFKKVLNKLVLQPSEMSNVAILGAAALIVSELSEEKISAPKVKKEIIS